MMTGAPSSAAASISPWTKSCAARFRAASVSISVSWCTTHPAPVPTAASFRP
jgi:hypothetical protein